MSVFKWTDVKTEAAFALAEGQTQRAVAAQIGMSEKTIHRWLRDAEFGAEVDRLTLMLGVASRAERLRIAKRVVHQRTSGELVQSDRDLLDWLKYAQSETDGIKLDLTALADASASLADRGSVGVPPTKSSRESNN